MADYRITFARSAGKELHQLNPPFAQRILAAIQRLAVNPRPAGCVKLTGSEND
jgi:mRNA interferase RelE/StbE